ncbi:AAA domain-containing protein [Ferrovum sp.]|uniref:AAA domain-containing protein n=1 Tax=Ferrovum sp. TaxID=2609467 RepID=UPI0026299E87|nr:AAA domain-containing protein [Ferrovum sp.]
MNASIPERILAALTLNPGLTSREIASQLSLEKKEVNSALYDTLKGKCQQDDKYRWFPVVGTSQIKKSSTDELSLPYTPFSRLCQYYLACLSQDEDAGISVFAVNRHGDLDYHELDKLPLSAGSGLFQSDGARRLLGRVRSDRGRLAMYFGYPCALKHQRSRKSNWEGFFIEPLLLFPVEMSESRIDSPSLETGFPVFNHAALRRFSNAERDGFLEELVQLEMELGLTDAGEIPDLDELARRLAAMRPEWPWLEEIDPDTLPASPALSDISKEGIYNRAVLVIGERSPFTQGLETELKQLARLPIGQLDGTVLGQWLKGSIPEKNDRTDTPRVIEVLPLNTEQRQAIEQAMEAPLTIITGPPGTGKSQIVTDLLINAVWYGKRVVFASKNNKAVDVVETRINNLGPRPILLRVGSNKYQIRLAEYLVSLLAASASNDDILAFNEAKEIHQRIESELYRLSGSERLLIELRNNVDGLDQKIEEARQQLTPEQIHDLKSFDLLTLIKLFADFRIALSGAIKDRQGLLTKLFWGISKSERFQKLEMAGIALSEQAHRIGASLPTSAPDDALISDWQRFSVLLNQKITLSKSVKDYFDALAKLQSSRPLESIAKEQADLLKRMSNNADQLWKFWLRLQPTKLTQSDRQLLQKYGALLKMVIEAGPEGTLATDIYRQYRDLFPRVAHLLPCWAVTSLSARGKVPFEAGFFDLVIFDEASQCDIASALPLLYRAKRAVIIGDPKQLSHISGLPRGQDRQLLQKFDLVNQFPHWAYSYNSLFDLGAGFASSEDIVNLRDHHRSHADIIEFSNRFFYEGRLRVATRYNLLKRPTQEKAGVRWVDVTGQVSRPSSGGAINPSEAKAVVQTLRDLVIDKGYRGSVGVVSPFRAQADLIREFTLTDGVLSEHLSAQEFLVDTVHKFQGDERDVMVFSPVVSSGITPGAISFLKNNGNLFNVAITRARAQLIVVGDRNESVKCDVAYLADFAAYVSHLDRAEEQRIKNDTSKLGPNYPSVVNPERVSDWERLFYRALYEAGIRPLPQYQVEKYTLDFAIFAGDCRLDVEVDGERYHRNWTGELCHRDQLRNQRLIELGWDVIRFWVYEIRDDMEGCIRRIKHWVELQS